MPRITDAYVEKRADKRGLTFEVITLGPANVAQGEKAYGYVLSRFPLSILNGEIIDTQEIDGTGIVNTYRSRIFVPDSSITDNISFTRLLEKAKKLVEDITK